MCVLGVKMPWLAWLRVKRGTPAGSQSVEFRVCRLPRDKGPSVTTPAFVSGHGFVGWHWMTVHDAGGTFLDDYDLIPRITRGFFFAEHGHPAFAEHHLEVKAVHAECFGEGADHDFTAVFASTARMSTRRLEKRAADAHSSSCCHWMQPIKSRRLQRRSGMSSAMSLMSCSNSWMRFFVGWDFMFYARASIGYKLQRVNPPAKLDGCGVIG